MACKRVSARRRVENRIIETSGRAPTLFWLDAGEFDHLGPRAACAVVKSPRLKRGEKVRKLGTIRVFDVRQERLDRMLLDLDHGFDETAKEGFPIGHPCHWTAVFVDFFYQSRRGCRSDSFVTRLECEYV